MSPSDRPAAQAFERSYPGSTDSLNPARLELADWLDEQQLEAVTDDAQLVLSELASNAIEATPAREYHVVVSADDAYLSVAVSNEYANELPPRHEWAPTDVLAARGRGLAIVRTLSYDVTVTSDSRFTQVTARLKLSS